MIIIIVLRFKTDRFDGYRCGANSSTCICDCSPIWCCNSWYLLGLLLRDKWSGKIPWCFNWIGTRHSTHWLHFLNFWRTITWSSRSGVSQSIRFRHLPWSHLVNIPDFPDIWKITAGSQMWNISLQNKLHHQYSSGISTWWSEVNNSTYAYRRYQYGIQSTSWLWQQNISFHYHFCYFDEQII